MQIELNGILYETTEETKDQYVIRYFADRVIDHVLKLAKEFQDIKRFNDAKLSFDSEVPKLDKNGKRIRTEPDNRMLNALDVSSSDTNINYNNYKSTTKNEYDPKTDPERKKGHFSGKRFDQFNNNLVNEYETKLNFTIKKSEEGFPFVMIPLKEIINEKTYKQLVGYVDTSKNSGEGSLSEINLIRTLVQYYSVPESSFASLSSESAAFKIYSRIMRKKGVNEDTVKNSSNDDVYYGLINYLKEVNISKFISMIYNDDLLLVTGNHCFPSICVSGSKSHAKYAIDTRMIMIPFFKESNYKTFEEKKIMIDVFNIKQYRAELYSTLIHELNHAYDTMNNEYLHLEGEGKEYLDKPFEVRAFVAQLAEYLEIELRTQLKSLELYRTELRKTVKSGDEFYSIEYNDYVRLSNEVYKTYKDEDSFLNYVQTNTFNGSELFDLHTKAGSIINKMNNNERFKSAMLDKLKPWYADFRERYGKVIPSKELPLKKPKQSLDEAKFKGTCDRFRKTKIGEDEWQEMMSTATRINQRDFMKNVEIEDALDEDETWKEFLHVHRDVKFFESPKYYFMQTHGFEYIWAKEIEEEDIIK